MSKRYILVELADSLPHSASSIEDIAEALETLLTVTLGEVASVTAVSEDEIKDKFSSDEEGDSK